MRTYNPYRIVRDLEDAISEYTGAPYVVTVNSCTMALLLAVKWYLKWYDVREIEIPKYTYVSVPMSILHAGCKKVKFRDESWLGLYQLSPLPVYDSARLFTNGMYNDYYGAMLCVSFHATKVLGDTQGGAILLDDADAYAWLKRMRFDGRTEGVAPKSDRFTDIGYHCYMSPDVAARLLHRLCILPKDNLPLPNDDYADLSMLEIFK